MKRVIISGAGGGLGKITTRYFLEKGYAVTAILSGMDKLDQLPDAPALEKLGLDLLDEASVAAFVEDQFARHEKIDGVLMLAGGFAAGDLAATDGPAVQQQIDLNFMTAYHLARPAFLHMKKQGGGRLVFIGARPAITATAGKHMMAYSLAKSLLFRLAENLNADAAGTSLTATVLAPSTIDTPANRVAMPDADPAKWVSPEHLASIMEWLFSAPAGNLRETVLKVYNRS